MKTTRSFAITGGLLGLLAIGTLETANGQTADKDRESDRAAIQKAANEFTELFAKADAKAIASHWTEQGEFQEDGGVLIVGRKAIEGAYEEFFKNHPKCKIEVDIHLIHFPARDLAIEEGSVRLCPDGPELPTSSEYSAIHVREDGQWKMAVCREFGSGEDRLHDLNWLLGKWSGGDKENQSELTFESDKNGAFILGTVTKKANGETVSTGTFKIGADPQTGQLRSWHFNDDGSHGQALWQRDGNQWLLDSRNVLADGTGHAALNILSKTANNELLWRSVEHIVEDEPLGDSVPTKFTRVDSTK